jgi:hypothetical protein
MTYSVYAKKLSYLILCPLIYLAIWAPLAHYGCKSLAHLLYQTSLLGLPNAILGVYGNNLDTMYDALGPWSRVSYSADK